MGGGRGVRAVWVPAHRPAPQPPLLTLADWRGNSRADALATQALASAQPPEALLAAALQADAEYVAAVRVGAAVLEAELAWAHLGIESGPTRFPRKRPRVRFQARPARPASAIPVPVGPVLLQHLPTRALRVSTLWRSSAARQGPSLSTGLPAVGRPYHVPNGAIWLTPRVEGGLRPWLLRRVLHGRGSTATCRLRARALSFACDVASVPLPRGRRSGAAGCASPGASGRRVKLRLWIGAPSWLCNLVGPPGPSRASATILDTLRRDPGPQPREVMPVELVVPFATRFGHGARSRRRFDVRSQASPFRALFRQPLRLGPPLAPCPALRASEPAGGSGCGLIGGPMSSPSPPAGHPLRAAQASAAPGRARGDRLGRRAQDTSFGSGQLGTRGLTHTHEGRTKRVLLKNSISRLVAE